MYNSIIAGHFTSSKTRFSQHNMLHIAVSTLFCALAMTAIHAQAQEHRATATAQYQTDRENCLQGHTNEDQKTCLKEAGAALEANRRGQLNDNNAQYEKNAVLRCQALDGDDRDACLRRMQGEGSVSGSAASGGVFRELVTPVPDPHRVPAAGDSSK